MRFCLILSDFYVALQDSTGHLTTKFSYHTVNAHLVFSDTFSQQSTFLYFTYVYYTSTHFALPPRCLYQKDERAMCGNLPHDFFSSLVVLWLLLNLYLNLGLNLPCVSRRYIRIFIHSYIRILTSSIHSSFIHSFAHTHTHTHVYIHIHT